VGGCKLVGGQSTIREQKKRKPEKGE